MQMCYVLAGILGGEMRYSDGGQVLWVDYTRLALGKFGALRLDSTGDDPGSPDGEEMTPGHPLVKYYQPLINALDKGLASEGYRVVPFAYDWRKRIRPEGAALADVIRNQATPQLPCAIVGHSQGGLVARAAWANLVGTNQQNLIRRIVTLGTPHQGSYSPVEVWSLQEDLVRQLAGITTTLRRVNQLTPLPAVVRGWSKLELCQLTSTWPALYQLLPLLGGVDAANDPYRSDLFLASNWPDNREVSGIHLAEARDAFQAWLRTGPSMPPPAVLTTVAGTGIPTYGRLIAPQLLGDVDALGLADDGDGNVSTESALVPNSVRYSINSRHADLPRSAAIDHDLIQWVLDPRGSPTPIPPQVFLLGPVAPGLAGPPLPTPLVMDHDC